MSRHLLIVASLAWLGCSGAQSVWTAAEPIDAWTAERHADLHDPGSRAQAHLELAWACLLHGAGCAHLNNHAVAAVQGAPDMALAQLTRALALQAHADIGRRADAWLDLLLWATVQDAQTAPSGDLNHQLITAACEALSRLAVRDRAAVKARLARLSWPLERALLQGPALHRWRRAGALAGLLGSQQVAALRGAAKAPVLPELRWRPQPISRRMYSGLLAMSGPPKANPSTLPLPLAPMEASRSPIFRRGRHLLPASKPGVHAFEGHLNLPSSTSTILVIRCRRPMRVWLDGHEMKAAGDDALRAHRLQMGAGRHRIDLAISLAGVGEVLDIALLATAPSTSSPSAASSWPAPARAVLAALTGAATGRATMPHRWVSSPVAGLLGLERPLDLTVEGRAAEPLLDRLLDVLPAHVDARIDRAGRAREAGNTALARRLLAPLVAGAQTSGALKGRADLRLEQAWQHLGDGLGDLALTAVEALVGQQRDDCAVWRQAVLVGQDTLNRAALRRLLASSPGCPGSLGLQAEVQGLVGHLDSARRIAVVAAAQPSERWAAIGRVRRLSQTLAVAMPAAATTVAAEQPAQALWRRLQAALSADDRETVKPLQRQLLLGDHADMELRRQAWQVGARLPWSELLVQGRELAKAQAGTPPGGAPLTWLLDQEIAVLLPGGGALRRVHQVVRVHTVQAAEAVGEIRVPPESELIFARTIAADGSVILPAETPDKETVSLRQVGPGAVVEYAQVQFVQAEDPATGATRLAPFMFRSSDGPVVRSEYIVMAAPRARDVRLDASPSAPRPEVSTVQGWRRWVFRQASAERVRGEPRSQRPEWQLPMVRTSRRADLASVIAPFNEALAAYDRADDAALAPWRLRARAAGRDLQRWRGLVARIAATVEQKRRNLLPGHPAAAVRNKSGDRASLLYHLARLAGVDACLVRLVPLSREPAYGAPDPRDYRLDAVLFRLPSSGVDVPRQVWFDTGIDGGLVDFLQPGLRKRPGLLLGCAVTSGERQIQSPDLGEGRERRHVRMALDWFADGRVKARLDDTLRGAMGALVRAYLRRANAKQRTTLLRHLAGASMPGYELRWLGADALNDEDKPLVLHYEAHAAADPVRRLALDLGLFPARLGRTYAALPGRRTPMRLGQAWDVQVELELRNHGPALAPLPEAVQIKHNLVAYHRRARTVGSGALIERHLRSKMGVVAPADYPPLARDLRQIDRSDLLHLERAPAPPRGR